MTARERTTLTEQLKEITATPIDRVRSALAERHPSHLTITEWQWVQDHVQAVERAYAEALRDLEALRAQSVTKLRAELDAALEENARLRIKLQVVRFALGDDEK